HGLVVSRSVQLDAIVSIPGGHVGEDHLIADFEALDDFDGAHRGSTEFHPNSHGAAPPINHFEQTDGTIRLALHGTAYIERIVEPFQLDRAIHAPTSPGPA